MNGQSLIDALDYPLAGLGILVESAGLPLPGEVVLLASAAWGAAHHLSLPGIVLGGFAGALLGADLGYLVGYRGGRPFLERFGRVMRIDPTAMARSEMFFARYGDWAILVGRFVLGLRAWGSFLAGMARMPFWRFQLFSAAGSLLWALAFVAVGDLLGTLLATRP